MYENNLPHKRYAQTLKFLKSVVPPPANVLDLGVVNPFSGIMGKEGYQVSNTKGEDLDLHPQTASSSEYDIVTGFEILEHLVAPFNVLTQIRTQKLVVTIPLNLWFAKAYYHKTDPRDRHFHEFEDWQFDWLLEKSGWNIIKREKWTSPVKKVGIRPILRIFTPRYYAVYAEKKTIR